LRYVFPSSLANSDAGRVDFDLYVPKSVPQRLKPSSVQTITARLKPCPSFRDAFSFSRLALALQGTSISCRMRYIKG
jgi:hypothetical protein